MFAFDRTVSRLLEMQALEYVKASQAAFPQGAEWIQRTADSIATLSGEEGLLAQLQKEHVGEGSHAASLLLKMWKQYRIGSIDETNFPRRPAPGEAGEVLRLEDAAVGLADLAEFAVRLRQHSPNRSDSAAPLLQEAVVGKILPDRLEELVRRSAGDDWGNRFVSFGDFAAEATALLSQATR